MRSWALLFLLCTLLLVPPRDADYLRPFESTANGIFKLGEYKVAIPDQDLAILASCDSIKIYLANIALLNSAATASSLALHSRLSTNCRYNRRFSDMVNQCSAGRKFNESEVFYHAALAIWPWNVLAMKNMAFHLELNHHPSIASSLYVQGLQLLPGDVGLLMQQAFLSPHFLADRRLALQWHIRILANAHRILTMPAAAATGLDPTLDIRDIQVGAQYTGHCPGLIYEAYSRCLLKLFPALAQSNIALPPSSDVPGREGITLGVVSETVGNSSPGLCLQEILRRLASSHRQINLVFFSRPRLNTVFGRTMEEASVATFVLDETDIQRSVEIIRDEARPDILLYLALPTERFTVALAHHRLAPVQIQYGLGHPLSSGVVNSMDYSVISRQMLVAEADMRTTGERLGTGSGDLVDACALGASLCLDSGYATSGDISLCSEFFPLACYAYGHKGMHYSEQVVLFESLGFHIQDFSLMYFQSEEDVLRLHAAGAAHCPAVDALLKELSVAVSAEDIGCGGAPVRIHLYSCIQHGKKMHPDFDRALLGILSRDDKAKILLNDGSKNMLIRRWIENWEISADVIKERVLFIPRVDHPDYLRLLSLSSVFLNPFPFGSGITSSDAISVCIPLVLLPRRTSVLPFALAQVRALGPSFEALFVADSVEDYIERAVTLASESHSPGGAQLRRDMCSHKKLLFHAGTVESSVTEWATFLLKIASQRSQ